MVKKNFVNHIGKNTILEKRNDYQPTQLPQEIINNKSKSNVKYKVNSRYLDNINFKK